MQQASHHEVLKSLARFESGATFAEFQNAFPPGLLAELAQTLDNLRKAQFVAELYRGGHLCYEVTAAGRKILSSTESDEAAAREAVAPVEIRRCRPRPAVATLCLDEFSLNNWWEEQDVEVKANAFLLWTLGSTGAIADDDEEDEPAIPVAGAVSAGAMQDELRLRPKADPAVIRRLEEAIHGRPVAQADGYASEA
jgi:hypothetical protein